jgi:hypothetical protein
MEQIIKNALIIKGCKETTIEVYLRNIRTLAGSDSYQTLDFLGEEKVLQQIKEKNTASTRNSYLNSCHSVLRCFPFPEYETLTKKFKELADKQQEEINKEKERNRGVKTEKEEKNWIEWSDVMKRWSSLKKETENIRTRKSRQDVRPSEYNKLQQFVVLSLYCLTPPRRNKDYQSMIVVRKATSLRPALNPENGNYLVLDKGVFVFGDYKTSGCYGRQEIPIPEELFEILKDYLKFRPSPSTFNKRKVNYRNQGLLLTDYNGESCSTDNYMTRLLNRIFDNKTISTGMLRHSYVSEFYKGIDPKVAFKIAEHMGHSPQMALGTYVKGG